MRTPWNTLGIFQYRDDNFNEFSYCDELIGFIQFCDVYALDDYSDESFAYSSLRVEGRSGTTSGGVRPSVAIIYQKFSICLKDYIVLNHFTSFYS